MQAKLEVSVCDVTLRKVQGLFQGCSAGCVCLEWGSSQCRERGPGVPNTLTPDLCAIFPSPSLFEEGHTSGAQGVGVHAVQGTEIRDPAGKTLCSSQFELAP